MVSGHFDATCPSCKKHIAWNGKITDRPNCPGCGWNLPPDELMAQQADLDAMFQQPCNHENFSRAMHPNGHIICCGCGETVGHHDTTTT